MPEKSEQFETSENPEQSFFFKKNKIIHKEQRKTGGEKKNDKIRNIGKNMEIGKIGKTREN